MTPPNGGRITGTLERIDETFARLFEAGPTAASRRRATAARLAACTSVSLTGIALLTPNLAPFLVGGRPPVGTGLALLGGVVCVGLVLAGAALYRSGFSTPNAVRISVWNLLGVVVLGGVLLLHGVYRGTLGTVTPGDALAAGNVLAISAAAHVLIGVHDARRVRAEQLARERERLAVLSRVVRHNLRNDATVLMGHAARLRDGVDDESLADAAAVVHERAGVVGGLAEKSKTLMATFDRQTKPNARVDVTGTVESVVDAVRADHPDVRVETDVEAGLWAWADAEFETAVAELVENALEHGGTEVAVTATVDAERVRVRVADDGPGIPDVERAVVTGEAEITQLEHGSGLGLWVVRSIAEAGDGTLSFETTDGETVVTLSHRRADPPAEGSTVRRERRAAPAEEGIAGRDTGAVA